VAAGKDESDAPRTHRHTRVVARRRSCGNGMISTGLRGAAQHGRCVKLCTHSHGCPRRELILRSNHTSTRNSLLSSSPSTDGTLMRAVRRCMPAVCRISVSFQNHGATNKIADCKPAQAGGRYQRASSTPVERRSPRGTSLPAVICESANARKDTRT
jgi:hypothetical protein